MKKLRVCNMITDLGLGGAERCVLELTRRLDRDRFDVHVVSLRGGAMVRHFEQAGIPVQVLGVRGKWDAVKLAGLTNFLRRHRFDILHTHLFHADLAGRPAARLAAVAHIVHTVHMAEERFRPWRFAYARFLSEYCDRIVCVSNAVRENHQQRTGLPDSRYSVIYNGVDVDAYSRDDNARRANRADWGVAEGDMLLAYVGKLSEQKGITMLLDAVSHLGARGKPVKLVLAGEGDRRAIVENYIRHGEGGKHARLLGTVDDVRGVLSAADLFVMPSRWGEGFGLAAAEAMAARLPVVATRVAGLTEVVVDGETGVLIQPDDMIALSDAIERLADDPELCRQYGTAGHRRVASEFNIDKNVAAHEQLYQEVACR